MHLTRRSGNVLVVLFTAALLGYAYYAQFVLKLEPCPLCIFQRVAIFAVGVVALLAALHNPRGTGMARVYGVLMGLAALLGLGIAIRHVYIQSQPEGSVPACGATLDYLMDVFPLTDVIRKVLTGSGECAKVEWTFIGMSMPQWLVLVFGGLLIWGVWNNWRRRA